MTTAVAPRENLALAVEEVLVQGNLSQLTPEQRVEYYNRVCDSVGLNPLTKPFEYITLNGKLTLYARKDATDQLRNLKGISVQIVSREMHEQAGLYVVTARATTPDGRTDESIGAVTISKLTGEALANALMKCETKAKRRVTLSIAGLGLLDETEVDDIPERDKRGPVVMPVAKALPQKGTVARVLPETGEMRDVPDWTLDDLSGLVKAAGLEMAAVAAELNIDKLTRGNVRTAVDRWLFENPDCGLPDLVAAAAAATEPAEVTPLFDVEDTSTEPAWAGEPGLQ